MTKEKRKATIIKKIKELKKVEISDLSKEFKVSEMTIRRDLRELEKENILTLISKGAIINIKNDYDIIDDTLKTRTFQNIKKKKIIAKYASTLVNEGDIIFLDASTTVYEICQYLTEKKITIITNSVRVAQYFNTVKSITLILIGGILRYATLSLIGVDAEEMLKKYNIDKLFMSSKAISYENGVTDVNIFEINMKKVAIKNSKQTIIMLDESKIDKVSLTQVCSLKEISLLITNQNTENSYEKGIFFDKLISLGVHVVHVEE